MYTTLLLYLRTATIAVSLALNLIIFAHMKKSTEINYQQRILRVLSYINKHLDDDMSLEQLADLAHFSPYHFHRIFTQITGESLKEYIRRRKTHRAVIQLGLSDRSITAIALDAGFSSTEAFSRHIKKHYQRSPRELRYNSKELIQQLEQRYQDTPDIDISIVQRDAIDVAYLLHIGPYEEAVQAWETMAALVGLPALLSDDTQCYGIPYDHALWTDPDKCHYAACINWQPHYADIKKLNKMTLSSGRHAKVVHYGDISKIDQTYDQFTQYILKQDTLEFADAPSFMHYVDLANLQNPDDQVTEIYFPLVD